MRLILPMALLVTMSATLAQAQVTTYDEFGRPHTHTPPGFAPMQSPRPIGTIKPIDGGQMFKPYKPYEPPKPFTGVHVDADGPFTRGGTFAPQPKRPHRPGEPSGF